MGGARSTIERHPERSRIEAALRAGTPATHVAEQFNLSRQAVSRHKVKLLSRPTGTVDTDREEMLRRVRSLYNGVLGLIQSSHDEKNPTRFLKGISEARKCLTLLSKIVGVLNDAPAPAPVNVAVQVDMTELRGVMVGALGPYPDASAAVAQALLDYDARAAEGEA